MNYVNIMLFVNIRGYHLINPTQKSIFSFQKAQIPEEIEKINQRFLTKKPLNRLQF